MGLNVELVDVDRMSSSKVCTSNTLDVMIRPVFFVAIEVADQHPPKLARSINYFSACYLPRACFPMHSTTATPMAAHRCSSHPLNATHEQICKISAREADMPVEYFRGCSPLHSICMKDTNRTSCVCSILYALPIIIYPLFFVLELASPSSRLS